MLYLVCLVTKMIDQGRKKNETHYAAKNYTQLQTLQVRGGSKQMIGTKVWHGNLLIENVGGWSDNLCIFS